MERQAMLKENICQPNILNPVRTAFKNESKVLKRLHAVWLQLCNIPRPNSGHSKKTFTCICCVFCFPQASQRLWACPLKPCCGDWTWTGAVWHTALLGARVRYSAHGKGHEKGGSTYAKAGSSLRSPPGNPRASTPITRAWLLYYFVLLPTPLTLRGAVPHHLFRRRS